MYRVEFTRRARKDLQTLPAKYQVKIRNRIDVLIKDPLSGKPLKGKYEGLYSLRVWPYRIIYKILKKKLLIEVIDIGHRQGVYRK